MQKQSVIILGHGSRSIQAKEDFNYVVDLLKEKMNNEHVYGAHMELTEPSLEDVVEKLSHFPIEKVYIIPYFLFNGNHIKIDIPEKIEALKKLYPQMSFFFGSPIGQEPLMADIMLKKIKELE